LDAPRPMNSVKMYVQSAGEWKKPHTIKAGRRVTLTAPGKGHWAAMIKAVE